jgi:transposase
LSHGEHSVFSSSVDSMHRAYKIWLSREQEDDLQRFTRSRSLPARLVERSKMLLLGAAGHTLEETAEQLGVVRQTVSRWLGRYVEQGLAGVEKDAPRSGRPPRILSSKIAEIVEKTTQEKPAGCTHWSTRIMAPVVGVSASSVGRIWRAHGLQPHRVKNFKLSNDPRFAEKMEDVVELYLHPPADAIILSLDEKCQIQALDRSQPGLPWKKGRCGTMTHDYKRHGTTTLFTAMNTQDGSVMDMCLPTHNHKDWIRFLKLIDGRTPKDKVLHLIMDNYSAHKTPEVNKWLKRHPRFHVHFIPTSSSWLNQVERFFRDLTDKCIRRGVFHSVGELQQAIRAYIDQHNQNPKPYLWTAAAKDILEKVKRAWKSLLARGYAPKKLAALNSIERRLAATSVAAVP